MAKKNNYHNFKYQPKKKPKVQFLSGYKEGPVVYKYHCGKCDSTFESKEFVTENEVNKFFSNPANNFPCISKEIATP